MGEAINGSTLTTQAFTRDAAVDNASSDIAETLMVSYFTTSELASNARLVATRFTMGWFFQGNPSLYQHFAAFKATSTSALQPLMNEKRNKSGDLK